MTPTQRLTAARLRSLADELPPHHIAILTHLAAARVLSGHQLDRLFADSGTDGSAVERVRQRAAAHLAHIGLIATLDRRIGGVRAGSAGHVHVLTRAGHRFRALRNREPQRPIRHSRAPGPMFINHALDIAEIYVQLVEKSRYGGFRLSAYMTEPATWWPIGHGLYLRPDAYAVLAAERYRDCWWIEVDRDTESTPRLKAKCVDYLDHAIHGGTGPDNALPRVLFTAPNPRRCQVISDLITGLPPPADQLFCAVEHQHATSHLITALHDQ